MPEFPFFTSVTPTQQAKIADWWLEFGKNAPQLAQYLSTPSTDSLQELAAWTSQRLDRIEPSLMFEYGPGIAKKHRLVITPEVQRKFRPLVNRMLATTPDLPDWEFYGYRPAESAEQSLAMVGQRLGIDPALLSQMRFNAKAGENNKLDLVFYYPDWSAAESPLNVAFLLCERLLGERDLEKWVGVVDIEPLKGSSALFGLIKKAPPTDTQTLSTLKTALEQHQQKVWDSLSTTSYQENAGPKTISLAPQKAEDYPGQQDKLTAVSWPKLLQATNDGSSFDSERFSRRGEWFCYLKIDGSAPDNTVDFLDRKNRDLLQEHLDAALNESGLGTLVGAGSGLRYSYIEMALVDLEQSLPFVRQTLQNQPLHLPNRTWILFHDKDLSLEWVGVYDHTEAPPLSTMAFAH